MKIYRKADKLYDKLFNKIEKAYDKFIKDHNYVPDTLELTINEYQIICDGCFAVPTALFGMIIKVINDCNTCRSNTLKSYFINVYGEKPTICRYCKNYNNYVKEGDLNAYYD